MLGEAGVYTIVGLSAPTTSGVYPLEITLNDAATVLDQLQAEDRLPGTLVFVTPPSLASRVDARAAWSPPALTVTIESVHILWCSIDCIIAGPRKYRENDGSPKPSNTPASAATSRPHQT